MKLKLPDDLRPGDVLQRRIPPTQQILVIAVDNANNHVDLVWLGAKGLYENKLSTGHANAIQSNFKKLFNLHDLVNECS